MEQLGLEPVLIWYVSVAGFGLTPWAITLVLPTYKISQKGPFHQEHGNLQEKCHCSNVGVVGEIPPYPASPGRTQPYIPQSPPFLTIQRAASGRDTFPGHTLKVVHILENGELHCELLP